MATLEDIVAATRLLAEDSILAGGVGSNQADEHVRNFSIKEVGGSALSAAGSKQIIETEAGVDTTFHKDNGRDGGGDCQVKEKNRTECLEGAMDLFVRGNGSLNSVNGREGPGDKKSNERERKGFDLGLDGEVNDNNLEHRGHGFLPGDFVWGKIKNHPWWPGQVHDTIDASEFAVKHGQEGRILVAFFGDGSCSWCTPSQLVPFVENFERMSKDCSSKSFLCAVQSALDEVGRLVESDMTCVCVPSGVTVHLARPPVNNAGVKAGVLMPEVNVHRVLLSKFEPVALLAKLKSFAEAFFSDNLFELVVLTSWLSAFYRFKGGYSLSPYQDPRHIEGLEDKNDNIDAVANDFSVPIAVPILGPMDDHWLSSPVAGTAKYDVGSDDKIYHRRKERSVAEIMGDNIHVRPKFQKRYKDNEDEKSESDPSQRRSDDEIDIGDYQKASSIGKQGRKRNIDFAAYSGIKSEKVNDSENDSVGGVSHANEDHVVVKPKKIEVSGSEIDSGEAKDESEVITTPRKRKKSKYLSPPFTNLELRSGNLRPKIESDKFTNVAEVEEHVVGVTQDLLESPLASQSVDRYFSEDRMSDGQPESLDIFVHTGIPPAESDKIAVCDTNAPVCDTNTPVDALLSEIRFAALDPLYLSKERSLDMVWDFVSALRSSTFIHGPNYKIYDNYKIGKKRKSPSIQLGDTGNNIAKKKTKLNYLKFCKEVAQKTAGTSGTSKSNKAAETSLRVTNAKKVEEEAPPRLILTFIPEHPLPSKNEIVNLFEKFGSLNEKETTIFPDSHAVHIVYMKDSDAVAAFKASVSQSPFITENVSYRLQRRGFQSKVSSPLRQTPDKADDRLGVLISNVGIIKQKLNIVTAILENYRSQFLPEDKSSLENEMKHLTETVEMVSEQVIIMAEKTSSS